MVSESALKNSRSACKLRAHVARFCLGLAGLVSVSLSFVIVTNVRADERELPTPKSTSVDVVLVLDASGSMLKTDPEKLRYEGAKLLLSFLGEGDRIGVVGFAGVAKVVRELEPFSPAVSTRVAKQIQEIQADGAFSDIAEGVKLGKVMLDARSRPDAQRVMVLISDGKMEPNPAVSQSFARTLELVHDVLPELKSKEIKVFTLAFSEQADRPFLSEIAAATDGLTWFTETSQDIHKSFADLFLAMKRPQIVSQTGRGFTIDDDVAEATFYINHAVGSAVNLESPRGELFSANRAVDYITWFSATNFDVVTIKEPDPGQWKVLGASATDGFATVMTDLKLLTDWPLVIRAGDEPLVQARLYEDEKPVSLPDMSGVVTYAFQIVPTDRISQPVVQEEMRDDGKGYDKVALDGIFSAKAAIERSGEYKLTVVAKGPTFQRSQQIPFTVRQRIVRLEIRDTDESSHKVEDHKDREVKEGDHRDSRIQGNENAEFFVKVSKEVSSFKSFGVSLIAISEDREKTELEMKRGRGFEFSVSAAELPAAGTYTIKAVLRGESKKGEGIEGKSEEMKFVYSPKKIKETVATLHQSASERDPELQKKAGQVKFPVISVGLVSMFNLMVFASIYFVARQRRKNDAPLPPRYLPHKQLMDAIDALEERTSATSVELQDPIFTVVEASRASGSEGPADATLTTPEEQSEVMS